MSNSLLIVNVIAALLIIFIFWWFFGGHTKVMVAGVDEPIKILVKNGIYQPALIQVPADKQVKLHFLREDTSTCSAMVVFTQLKLSYPLALNQLTTITLPPHEKGEIDFTCQMGMYRGKIIFS
jgi:plastocyanin domain-containing protein